MLSADVLGIGFAIIGTLISAATVYLRLFVQSELHGLETRLTESLFDFEKRMLRLEHQISQSNKTQKSVQEYAHEPPH